MEQSAGAKHESTLATSVTFSATVTSSVRSYMSREHLVTAERLAKFAKDREDVVAAGGEGPLPGLDEEAQGYAIGAVMLSVAFVEAAINELFQDAADNHAPYVSSLPAPTRDRWARFWRATATKFVSILEKYEMALVLADLEAQPRGEAPYQDVRLVIDLRNYLTHFLPRNLGDGEDEVHKLEAKLIGKFDSAANMKGSGNRWFPAHALGAGCARWAVDSARAFVEDFAQRTGIKMAFQMGE